MSESDERINIPDGYFEEEVRDDFHITEMMKRSFAAQIHLLKILEEFFTKHGIKYTATWGTLLGAIRHNGFIPWDDDIDINISRKDFWKLLEHQDELPHNIWILSIYSSDDFYNFHAVIKNNRRESTDILDDEREKEFCGFPFMTGIDIYILDNIPDDENEMKVQKSLYEFGYSLVHRYVELERRASENDPAPEEDIELFLEHLETYLEQVRKAYGDRFVIDDERPLLNELCRLVDGIASLYCDIDCKKVSSFTECPGKKIERWGRDAKLYRSIQEVAFEYTTISVPERSKDLLVTMFGENFMIPKKTGGKHEYPQYRSPAKVLGFNIEYAELRHYVQHAENVITERICGWDGNIVTVAFSIESIITAGGNKLDELEKLLEELTSGEGSKNTLVCWFAFGFLDRENCLWRAIPHTMKRYESIRDKYMGAENVINALFCDVRKVIGLSSHIYGEGSILDAYLNKNATFNST